MLNVSPPCCRRIISAFYGCYSPRSVERRGCINSILDESKRFAADIADRLRERIYEIVVPQLAMGIAKARNLTAPSKDDIALTYEMALTVLFRLLFIAMQRT